MELTKLNLTDLLKDFPALHNNNVDLTATKEEGAARQESIVSNTINIANTNFKIDSLMEAAKNDMHKGFVDVLASLDGIDLGLSSDYYYDSILNRIGTIPPFIVFDDFNRPDSDIIGGLWEEIGGEDGDILSNKLRVFFNTLDPPANQIRHPISFGNDLIIKIDAFVPNFTTSGQAENIHILDGNPASNGVWAFNFKRNTQISLQMYSSAGWEGVEADLSPGEKRTLEFRYHYSTRTVDFVVDDVVKATGKTGGSSSAWIPYANGFSLVAVGWPPFYGDFDNFEVSIPGATANPATIVTKAVDTTTVFDDFLPVMQEILDGSSIAYSLSRDDGTTWTVATNKVIADLSGQPSGQLLRLKAIIQPDAFLDDLSVWW